MAKAANIKIKLLSTADTGFFYVTSKNARTKTEKFTFKKYDPVARKHVEFKETKIKYGLLVSKRSSRLRAAFSLAQRLRPKRKAPARSRGFELVAGQKRHFEEATPTVSDRPTPRTQEMRRT